MITKQLIKDWGKFDYKAYGLKENFHGVAVFVGRQGSGKTISILNTALSILKKDVSKPVVYTNLPVNDERFVFCENREMRERIKKESNCIFLLDEIHLYYNTGSKNPNDVMTPFSQLRKRNIIVLGSSQIWFHLDKKIRDQALYLVVCSKGLFNLWFKNSWVDSKNYRLTEEGFLEILGVDFNSRFWVQRRLFNLYDTTKTISSQNFLE